MRRNLEVSPDLQRRAIAWIQGVRAEIRRLNSDRSAKSQYGGVAVKKYETVCVAQLKEGDVIKLRLSNKSSNQKARLWTITKAVPCGISAHLWLECPASDFEANVILRLDQKVLRGERR